MSTTKVLHVIARMNVGGTARYVENLIESIPGSVVATGFVQAGEIEDPAVIKLPMFRIPHLGRKISPTNDFKAWLELRSLVKSLQPDIIHTHTFKAGLIGRLIGGNRTHIHTFHGHLFTDQSFSAFEKRVIVYIERYLARKTNVLISVGESVVVELRTAGIGSEKTWLSIPPGVNPLPLIDKKLARKVLGLPAEGLIIGWMARMTGVKNPKLLLEVAKLMPEARFAMAGGGDLLEEIEREAPKNLQVLGWCRASCFWSAVDCAVSTSDNEGMPIALIEAQLAGVPVVATSVGSSSEVIADGSTGYVVERKTNLIVEGLNSLIRSQTLLESFSAEAIKEKELYQLKI